MVLRRQPITEVINVIANLIEKTARLYSIQDWTNEKSVDLAEWIYNNYSCEMIGTIQKVLSNPPAMGKPIWRLTPDTVREWMTIELERICDVREQEVNSYKRKETGAGDLLKQVLVESDEFDREEAKFKTKMRKLAKWLKNDLLNHPPF